MFVSPIGLKMLSDSDKWHSNGTFHTKSRYFAQLYTIHAYFPPSKFEPQNPDKVWVKRMIPCVWSFMKRRRTKDYVKLLETLIKEARKIGLTLKPIQVMIDFEIATKKASEKVFINQLNNSSLLENTDFENERAEIPPETIIPPKTNTAKCIHCGKSYTSRGVTKNFIQLQKP